MHSRSLHAYYVIVLTFSLITLLTCIGQIVLYNVCETWQSDTAQQSAMGFYGLTYLCLAASLFLSGYTTWALQNKMGYGSDTKTTTPETVEVPSITKYAGINLSV